MALQKSKSVPSNPLLLAYRRISLTELEGNTKEQKEASADKRLKLQTDEVEKYVKFTYPDAKIIWYEDRLVSGTSIGRRIKFQELMADLDTTKPFGVVFTKIDRFARSTKDLLNTADTLKNKGIAIIATMDRVDTSTPQGYLFFTILGAFAEFEASIIKERTNNGKAIKQAEMELTGRNWGRPRHVVKNKLTREKFQLSDTDISNIKEMYKTGSSINAIADHYHISTKPIWNIINSNYKALETETEELHEDIDKLKDDIKEIDMINTRQSGLIEE